MRSLTAGALAGLSATEVLYGAKVEIRQSRAFRDLQEATTITAPFAPVGFSYVYDEADDLIIGVASSDNGYIWLYTEANGWFRPTYSGDYLTCYQGNKPTIVHNTDLSEWWLVYQYGARTIYRATINMVNLVANNPACISANGNIETIYGLSAFFSADVKTAIFGHEETNLNVIYIVFENVSTQIGIGVALIDLIDGSFVQNSQRYFDPFTPETGSYLTSAAVERHVFVSVPSGKVVKASVLLGNAWTGWIDVVPADLSKFTVHNAYKVTPAIQVGTSRPVYHLVGTFQRVDPLGSFDSPYIHLFDMTSLDPECKHWHMGEQVSVGFWNEETDAKATEFDRICGVFNTSTGLTRYIAPTLMLADAESWSTNPFGASYEIDNVNLIAFSGDLFGELSISISEGDYLRNEVDSSGRKWFRPGNIVTIKLRINGNPPFADSPSSTSNEIPWWIGMIVSMDRQMADDAMNMNIQANHIASSLMERMKTPHYQARYSPSGEIADLKDLGNLYILQQGTEASTSTYYYPAGGYYSNTYSLQIRQLNTSSKAVMWVAQDPFQSSEVDLLLHGLSSDDGTIGLSAFVVDDLTHISAVLVNKANLYLYKYSYGIKTQLATVAISGSINNVVMRMRVKGGKIEVWCSRSVWSRSMDFTGTPQITYTMNHDELLLEGQSTSHVGVYMVSGSTNTIKNAIVDFKTASIAENVQTIAHLLAELSYMSNVIPQFPGDIVGTGVIPTLAMKDVQLNG